MEKQLSLVHNNITLMLKERNYVPLSDNLFSLNNPYLFFKSKNDFLIIAYIPIPTHKTVPSIEQLIVLIEKMFGDSKQIISHAIIITDVMPSHNFINILSNPNKEIRTLIEKQVLEPKKKKYFSKQVIENLLEKEITIIFEHFLSKELYYNIIEHRLVPQHTRLSEDEKLVFFNTLLFKPNDNPSDLIPKLLTTDPVARYYFYQPGDLIKIQRTVPNLSIFYRIVCKPS